jgi:hypothetical protein
MKGRRRGDEGGKGSVAGREIEKAKARLKEAVKHYAERAQTANPEEEGDH